MFCKTLYLVSDNRTEVKGNGDINVEFANGVALLTDNAQAV